MVLGIVVARASPFCGNMFYDAALSACLFENGAVRVCARARACERLCLCVSHTCSRARVVCVLVRVRLRLRA